MRFDELKLLSDNEIVSHIKENGNVQLFEVLFNRYKQKINDKCYGLVKDKAISRTLTEDILSKAFEKLASFRQQSSFSSWIYSITYNTCIDFLRNKKKLHYPEWNRNNELPEITDEQYGDEIEYTYENLMVVFEMIHPEEKALIIMKYIDELSLRQIGRALRISEDAVKMRLKRARTRLLLLYREKFINV